MLIVRSTMGNCGCNVKVVKSIKLPVLSSEWKIYNLFSINNGIIKSILELILKGINEKSIFIQEVWVV